MSGGLVIWGSNTGVMTTPWRKGRTVGTQKKSGQMGVGMDKSPQAKVTSSKRDLNLKKTDKISGKPIS
jgi:hypothetical protein